LPWQIRFQLSGIVCTGGCGVTLVTCPWNEYALITEDTSTKLGVCASGDCQRHDQQVEPGGDPT
jgi:hypothetical protein